MLEGETVINYDKYDWRMHYPEEKKAVAHCHGFEYASEMMKELYDAGFTLKEIAAFFDVTYKAISYQILRMGCKLQKHGGYRISNSKSGIPGVCCIEEPPRFEAQIYPTKKKIYLGRYRSKFHAVIARRWGELKYGHEGESRALKYIINHCTKTGYDLKHVEAVLQTIDQPRQNIFKIIQNIP